MKIYRKNKQVNGSFNNGDILEKKPIGFPQDMGKLKPYSNLFYWAFGWSDKGSTIGLHPHQGFEIMTFVLDGEISHYDTKIDKWRNLKKGDAQIIRSGSGISHAEKIHSGAKYFQIWFDPDLYKTLSKPANYNDYIHETFPNIHKDSVVIKTYTGKDAPVELDTPGLLINEYTIKNSTLEINVPDKKLVSIYIVEGELTFNEQTLNEGDFTISEDDLSIETTKNSRIFVIESLLKPGYVTYAERFYKNL